jgi:hypothetical protein
MVRINAVEAAPFSRKAAASGFGVDSWLGWRRMVKRSGTDWFSEESRHDG